MHALYKSIQMSESENNVSLDVGDAVDLIYAVVTAPNVEPVNVTNKLRLLVKDGVLDLYGSQINSSAGEDIAPGVIKTLNVGVFHFKDAAEYIVNAQVLMDGFQSKIDEQTKKFEEYQVLMDGFQSKFDEQVQKFEEFQVLMDGFQFKFDEQTKKFEEMQALLDMIIEVELVALKKTDDEIIMKNYSQDLQMKGNFEVLSNELYLLKTQLDKLEARLK